MSREFPTFAGPCLFYLIPCIVSLLPCGADRSDCNLLDSLDCRWKTLL